jgi:homoserine O-acetyltransferase
MSTTLQPTREGDVILAQDAPFRLTAGGSLQPVSIRYAIYGKLNERRDNAVLVCHALSGSARAADWWPEMFSAPAEQDGKSGSSVFDVSRDCVICTNILGSCYGSTGPTSINPTTGKAYGPDFPLVTIRDIVRAQAQVLDELGVEDLRIVIGASIGGMQALQWAVDYPERVEHCIAIGTAPLSAMGLALNHLQRQAIRLDPKFRGGRYPPDKQPSGGLGLARAIAMCSYKSAELFAERYARKPNRNGEDPLRSFEHRYDVAGYLDYQGEKFVQRFDANAYLVISKIMDTFDLADGYVSEAEALKRIQAQVSLVGITSDWLFPPEDVRALAERIAAAGALCDYTEFESSHGHDGFLAEVDAIAAVVSGRFNARGLAIVKNNKPHIVSR